MCLLLVLAAEWPICESVWQHSMLSGTIFASCPRVGSSSCRSNNSDLHGSDHANWSLQFGIPHSRYFVLCKARVSGNSS